MNTTSAQAARIHSLETLRHRAYSLLHELQTARAAGLLERSVQYEHDLRAKPSLYNVPPILLAAHIVEAYRQLPWLRAHIQWVLQAAGMGALYDRELSLREIACLLVTAYTALQQAAPTVERKLAIRRIETIWQVQLSWIEPREPWDA